MSEHRSGWTQPNGTGKYHFFETNSPRSVCTAWMTARDNSMLFEQRPPGPDDCRACARLIGTAES